MSGSLAYVAERINLRFSWMKLHRVSSSKTNPFWGKRRPGGLLRPEPCDFTTIKLIFDWLDVIASDADVEVKALKSDTRAHRIWVGGFVYK